MKIEFNSNEWRDIAGALQGEADSYTVLADRLIGKDRVRIIDFGSKLRGYARKIRENLEN